MALGGAAAVATDGGGGPIRDRAPVKAAGLAQLAVAIGILVVFPVRLGNLGAIRISENLIRPGGPGTCYWLVFPDYDVRTAFAWRPSLTPS